jgi:hypothetical protein
MNEDNRHDGWTDFHGISETNRREVNRTKSSLEPDAIDLSMFDLPTGTLTGDETENAVTTVHYNNVEYKDYEEFLRGWIEYYEKCAEYTRNIYDDRTLQEYREELRILLANREENAQ